MVFVKSALAAFLVVITGLSASAQVFSTRAENAILIDVGSGSVLMEKLADDRMPPASMAKMMTLAVVFDALVSGELALHDTMPVSENAWRKGGTNSGGSTMFLDPDPRVDPPTVEDLVRGIAVQSGNDASIVIAEGMSGTEGAFAQRMNGLARKIGMKNSNFTNSTGLPDPDQYTSAKDLAVLGRYLIEQFPDLYAYFAEPEFTWNDIRQFNRNPLFKLKIGADGIKTGFTKESGYGVAASALQGDRRLLLVINGLETRKARAEEAQRMLEWGFRAFQSIPIFGKDDVIGGAKVFGGEKSTVDVVAKRAVSVLLPKGNYGRLSARVSYRGPLKAPVSAGEPVGNLIIRVDGKEVQREPVFTNEDVETGTLQQRALDALFELTLGWF
ncbi:MAG: D-alanyl-D-alanine carboxypeptidase family protein [Pseudomonadota bacterium]